VTAAILRGEWKREPKFDRLLSSSPSSSNSGFDGGKPFRFRERLWVKRPSQGPRVYYNISAFLAIVIEYPIALEEFVIGLYIIHFIPYNPSERRLINKLGGYNGLSLVIAEKR
jgi:hypothetical protein